MDRLYVLEQREPGRGSGPIEIRPDGRKLLLDPGSQSAAVHLVGAHA